MSTSDTPYRLDRTAFAKQSFREASNHTEYWQNKSPEERFRAAYYLICTAYGFDWLHPPRMDKMAFSMRSHPKPKG